MQVLGEVALLVTNLDAVHVREFEVRRTAWWTTADGHDVTRRRQSWVVPGSLSPTSERWTASLAQDGRRTANPQEHQSRDRVFRESERGTNRVSSRGGDLGSARCGVLTSRAAQRNSSASDHEPASRRNKGDRSVDRSASSGGAGRASELFSRESVADGCGPTAGA